jgi:tetratricopeptide (TPR) repeat protein
VTVRRLSILLVLLLLASAHAASRKSAAPDEDPVALAGLLVREGDWERAEKVLAAIDPDAKGIDFARYWTLRGLTELHDREPAVAATSFQKALAVTGEGRELLELHLARALLQSGDATGAVSALDRTGEVGANMPGVWLLRADCYEALGRPDDAWQALESGSARFPDQGALRRQQVFLLVRHGLFREARELGEGLLGRPDSSRDDAVAISEALRQGGETSEAMTILESALLQYGDDRDLLVQAARAAIDDGQPRNAGRFLERAAELDPSLALEAAEAYRRGHDVSAALRMNGAVVDPTKKARQRLGLLLEAEAWDRAVALEDRLDRLGLAADDGVAYGLAFAWFRLGELERAEQRLKSIQDPEAFRRATELRQIMSTCDPVMGCP